MTTDENISRILNLARDLASKNTDEGLDKAAKILLHSIDNGCEDPEVLISAATYLLQGPHMSEYAVREKAILLADRAIARETDNISILEKAISCYELALNDFPEKIDDIIKINLRILDLNPEHIDSMITLASHRDHPRVALSLPDAIRMMEWAKEVEPHNIFVAYTLARLYLDARQYNKAKNLYRQIVAEGGPGMEDATSALQQIKSTLSFRSRKIRKFSAN